MHSMHFMQNMRGGPGGLVAAPSYMCLKFIYSMRYPLLRKDCTFYQRLSFVTLEWLVVLMNIKKMYIIC